MRERLEFKIHHDFKLGSQLVVGHEHIRVSEGDIVGHDLGRAARRSRINGYTVAV